MIPKTENLNCLRGIPNDWCLILKQQFSLCPICKDKIRSEYHMGAVHGMDIHSCHEIWANIKSFHDKAVLIQKKKKGSLEKVKRTIFLNYWNPRLKSLKEDTTYKFNLVYSNHRN